MNIRRFAAVVALAFAPASAGLAAPCAGFTDVDTTSAFCPNVEWLKNRAITLGCTSTTQYCPNDSVSRLAMAAFMNRLGTALTPAVLRGAAAPGAVDLDNASLVICQTADFVASGFPRRAYADLTFAGIAPADIDIGADLVSSTNGGAWLPLDAVAGRGSIPANGWGNMSNLGQADIDVGATIRFGVRIGRGAGSGSADLIDSRCELRALIFSRNGLATPY